MALSSLCTLFLASVVAISLAQGKDPQKPEDPKYVEYGETCLGRLLEKKYIYKHLNVAPVPSIKNQKGIKNPYLDFGPKVTWGEKEVSCGEEIDPKLFCKHPTIRLPQETIDYLKRTKTYYQPNGTFPDWAVAIWGIGLKPTFLPFNLPATLPPELTKFLKTLNTTIDKLPYVTYLYSLYYDISIDVLGEKGKGFDGTKHGKAKFPYEKPLALLDLKPFFSDFLYIIQVHAQLRKYGDIKAPTKRLGFDPAVLQKELGFFDPAELQTDLYLPVGAKFVTTHFKVDVSSLFCLNLADLLNLDLPKAPNLP